MAKEIQLTFTNYGNLMKKEKFLLSVNMPARATNAGASLSPFRTVRVFTAYSQSEKKLS